MAPGGAQEGELQLTFRALRPKWTPQTASRPPRGAQETQKRPPNGPQEAPRGFKLAPRGTREACLETPTGIHEASDLQPRHGSSSSRMLRRLPKRPPEHCPRPRVYTLNDVPKAASQEAHKRPPNGPQKTSRGLKTRSTKSRPSRGPKQTVDDDGDDDGDDVALDDAMLMILLEI